jgi:hypothetical protein
MRAAWVAELLSQRMCPVWRNMRPVGAIEKIPKNAWVQGSIDACVTPD